MLRIPSVISGYKAQPSLSCFKFNDRKVARTLFTFTFVWLNFTTFASFIKIENINKENPFFGV